MRLLTESINARHVVELGTANGYSGIWFAVALQTTGGKLTTFEIDPERERRPFANMLDLHKFLSQSLDSKQLTDLYTKMFIQLNLNTATREEIMLVPGMGNRMVREFLEYRPYTAIAQFRKEIGKYVDDKEVARLEQYVFVPININTASDETLLSIPGVTPQLLHALKRFALL